MLYKFLQSLFKLTQFVYFEQVKVVGIDKIKDDEANILILNHPSAFQDPILVGINLAIPVYFLVAEEFMGGKKMSKFLQKEFNMIPINRPKTRPDQTYKNVASFERCFEALNDKKNIIIFAEGHSETQLWLDPIKTGPARIALQALEANSNLKQVNIIPIGLNYSNPHQFRSTFFLNIGSSITILQNNNFDKNSLTQLAEDQLRQKMNGIDKEEVEWQELLLKIIAYNSSNNLETQFLKKERFRLNINLEKNKNTEKYREIKQCTSDFFKKLDSVNISVDDYLALSKNKSTFDLKFVLAVILFLPGLILNFIPLFITRVVVKNKKFKYSFEGSMYFAFGTLFTVLFYTLSFILLLIYFKWGAVLISIICFAFSILSLQLFSYIKQTVRLLKLNSKKELLHPIKDTYLLLKQKLEQLL